MLPNITIYDMIIDDILTDTLGNLWYEGINYLDSEEDWTNIFSNLYSNKIEKIYMKQNLSEESLDNFGRSK